VEEAWEAGPTNMVAPTIQCEQRCPSFLCTGLFVLVVDGDRTFALCESWFLGACNLECLRISPAVAALNQTAVDDDRNLREILSKELEVVVHQSIMFHRRNDASNASNEYRELILYEGIPVAGSWAVWEHVGFLHSPDSWRRAQLAQGWEPEMRSFIEEKSRRLLDEGSAFAFLNKIQSRELIVMPIGEAGAEVLHLMINRTWQLKL
jgi:hypothetical protein